MRSGGRLFPDLDTVLEELPGILGPHHNRNAWKRDIQEKIKAFELGQ